VLADAPNPFASSAAGKVSATDANDDPVCIPQKHTYAEMQPHIKGRFAKRKSVEADAEETYGTR
jgi:hypothetical protein